MFTIDNHIYCDKYNIINGNDSYIINIRNIVEYCAKNCSNNDFTFDNVVDIIHNHFCGMFNLNTIINKNYVIVDNDNIFRYSNININNIGNNNYDIFIFDNDKKTLKNVNSDVKIKRDMEHIVSHRLFYEMDGKYTEFNRLKLLDVLMHKTSPYNNMVRYFNKCSALKGSDVLGGMLDNFYSPNGTVTLRNNIVKCFMETDIIDKFIKIMIIPDMKKYVESTNYVKKRFVVPTETSQALLELINKNLDNNELKSLVDHFKNRDNEFAFMKSFKIKYSFNICVESIKKVMKKQLIDDCIVTLI